MTETTTTATVVETVWSWAVVVDGRVVDQVRRGPGARDEADRRAAAR